MFSHEFVQDLQKLSIQADSIETIQDLKKCLHILITFFDSPDLKRIINALSSDMQESNARLLWLRRGILKEFDLIERHIKSQYADPGICYCLDISKNSLDGPGVNFPSWREAGLRVALRHGIREELNIPQQALLFTLFNGVDKLVEESVNEMLQTANVTTWESEHNNNKRLYEIQRGICFVKKHKLGITNKTDKRKLKLAIQSVAAYCAYTVKKSASLSGWLIDTIRFEYRDDPNPQKRVLIVYINELSIKFEGCRAKNLYVLLSDPYSEKDIDCFECARKRTDDDSKKNDSIRQDFDDMNKQVCKKFYKLGFVYGCNELINSNKYAHCINPQLAHLIIKDARN